MTAGDVRIGALWAEDRGAPSFLGVSRPRLSWAVETELPDWRQAGWSLEVRRHGGVRSVSGDGPRSQWVDWPVEPLGSFDRADVRVRVRGVDGSTSGRSPWLSVATTALGADDLFGTLVTHPDPPQLDAVLRFRASVELPPARRALLVVTGHGLCAPMINGVPVTDEVLVPGWTSFDDRLTYATYDVTDHLRHGLNVVGSTVAPGWYGEEYGTSTTFRRVYDGPLALLAHLRVETDEGEVLDVGTDGTWEVTATGPVVAASLYHGEEYDARLEDEFHRDPAARPAGTVPAAPLAEPRLGRLVPRSAPAVRRIEEVPAREILRTPSGSLVVDFGQNLVGWVRIRPTGPAGTSVSVRHAEVLEHGELGVRPLRRARASDQYTLRGSGAEEWSPQFTFHGFQYAEIEGWPGGLSLDDVTAVVVHSDMVRTGTWRSGDSALDRLHENVVRSMRGNVVGLPTDCPQRDERLGWTGDIQVFAPTATYLYDVQGLLRSWLRDLGLEQRRASGVVPFVVPDVLEGPAVPAAAWGDAAVLVPWALHERYGDVALLREQYPSMRAWVEEIARRAGPDHLWTGGFQFGDWLDPSAPPDDPAAGSTDPDLVATAYLARSASVLAAAAVMLDEGDDAARYRELAARTRTAFAREFLTPAGRLASDSQTAYALALCFDLVDDDVRQACGERLAALARAHDYRIATGFVGTPLILDALTDTGHLATAVRMVRETGCPSWLYPVSMGATTTWERWDSMLPDGSINPGEMTSFNHYALGAVADWLHRVVGGLRTLDPGSAKVEVRPRPETGFTDVSTSLHTGFGVVSVRWSTSSGDLVVDLAVPPNAAGVVRLPGRDEFEVGSGSHRWTTAWTAVDAHGDDTTDVVP